MRVLTVNAGSTSLKLAVVADGSVVDRYSSLDEVLAGPEPDAVVHRVVHGGDRTAAAVVDDAVVAELQQLTALAPLHQPPALEALARCRSTWPAAPNVACFDTAFHTTIPPEARTYALPARFRDVVRVYGFHGLSYAWAASRLAAFWGLDRGRVVMAHLGGGQSLCAVRDGRSVMTTMGFTPLDGLVMATRCGSLDPGAVLWLQQQRAELDIGSVLEHESGLLGLCGTGDMREVRARVDAGDPDASFAFAVWRHRLVGHVGACVAALRGLDALVFTGGIGERDAAARAAVAGDLGWLGASIDDGPDGSDDREITAPGASVRTFVIHAREELQMAAEADRVLGSTA